MSSCWKCGKETPNGVIECAACEQVIFTASKSVANVMPEKHELDWNKVESFEDMKTILEAFSFTVWGGPETTLYQKLQRFFKD